VEPPAHEEAEPAPAKDQKVVRASMRLLIDIRALGEPGMLLRQALYDVQRYATTASNLVMRAYYRQDSQSLDDFQLQHGRLPKTAAEWPSKRINGYQLIRAGVPLLNTGIASVIARAVETKWYQDRYDVLVRQQKSTPHYRVGMSFPLRAAETRFLKTETGVVMSFSIRAGRHPGGAEFRVPISWRDDGQKKLLTEIADGTWKHGNVLIEQDRLRPGKWYARVAYTRFVAKKKEGISAAINRGMTCFLAAVTQTGEPWLYDGHDIEAYLGQIKRRRQSYQRDSKASSRWGHGRDRTLRPIKVLQDKGQRWRKTKCQVIARRLATWLAERNVARVYVEDFSGIRDGEPERLEGGLHVWTRIQEWPYHELQMRLSACLAEPASRPSSSSRTTSPRRAPLRHVAEENRDLRRWKLRCVKCKAAPPRRRRCSERARARRGEASEPAERGREEGKEGRQAAQAGRQEMRSWDGGIRRLDHLGRGMEELKVFVVGWRWRASVNCRRGLEAGSAPESWDGEPTRRAPGSSCSFGSWAGGVAQAVVVVQEVRQAHRGRGLEDHGERRGMEVAALEVVDGGSGWKECCQ
jgi:hypothetical protein